MTMTKGKRLSALLAATALGGLMAVQPAAAQSLQQLQSQVDALSRQVEDLKKQKAGELKVEAKGAPRFSGDGFNKFKVRGRLMADFGHVGDDGTEQASLGTTTEFRRARLGVEGEITSFKYKFEIDFADNEVDIADAYLQWKGKPVSVTIGNQKTPNSLEEQTSSRFTSLMERAQFTDAFGFSRELGIVLATKGDDYTFKAGAFSNGGFSDDDEANGYAFAARGTFSPKFDDVQMHFGAHLLYRDEGAAPTRYRQRPGIHTTDERFVDTRDALPVFGDDGDSQDLNIENDLVFGAEVAAIWNSLHFASEFAYLTSDIDPTLEDDTIGGLTALGDDKYQAWGGYAEVGYFITGETRGYKADKGAFDRTKPKNPVNKGGMGAIQINARVDYLDLNDDDIFPVLGESPGEQLQIGVGVIWIPISHVRFLVNYIYNDVSDAPFNDNGLDGEGEYNVFGIRAQIDW